MARAWTNRALSATFVGLVLLMTPGPARADDKSAAQTLFDEGLALFDAKEYAKAATQFANSQKLDPAAGTLLNLARCYEAMGNVASAWQAYGAAETLARKDGDAKREKVAAQKEAALAEAVPRLTVTLSSSNVGSVRVERDGVVLEGAALGVPIPIDPGPHKITATAPGRKPWSAELILHASEARRLEVPPLENARADEPVTPRADENDGSPGLGLQRTLAIVAAGTGLVAVGAGAYFGIHAKSLKSDADAHCSSSGQCDADGVSLTDRAGSAADASTGLFVASGALVATAVVLWVTAPSPSASSHGAGARRTTPRLSAAPLVGSSQWGGSLRISY